MSSLRFKLNTPLNPHAPETSKLEELQKSFLETINREDIGFYHLTDKGHFIDKTLNVCEKIKHKKNFIQIGIGGSALGPQLLVSSLSKSKDKNFYLIDNTDSDYISDILDGIDIQDSIFYVVSKSGGTAETIAGFITVRNLLLAKGISESNIGEFFIFCTDPENGQLRKYVNQHQYTSLEIPSNIGGRFSILTPVGLLPAAFMGVNIKELYEGANEIKQEIENTSLDENSLFLLSEKILSLKESLPQTVFMPYSSKLKDLSAWFIQLWAESLGKNGKGLTPIPAYGATDQHSQMQLFMEGPNDKLIMLLHLENKNENYSLDGFDELESAKKLSSYSMNELLEAEFLGTLKALAENSRNVIDIRMETLNERNLAKILMFLQCLTVTVGISMNINPFDQPGVEKGKIYAFEYLNSLRK